jgi:hypothetical protein
MQSRLTFEYILKLGESNGVKITEKMAKLIIKKNGRKDHWNVEACLKVNARRHSKGVSKSAAKDKK